MYIILLQELTVGLCAQIECNGYDVHSHIVYLKVIVAGQQVILNITYVCSELNTGTTATTLKVKYVLYTQPHHSQKFICDVAVNLSLLYSAKFWQVSESTARNHGKLL